MQDKPQSDQAKPVDIILFGNGQWAEFLFRTLTASQLYRVVAFTVDKPYIQSGQLLGVPVLAFDEIENHIPPSSAKMLIGLGFQQKNRLRSRKCEEAKAKGYDLIQFVSPTAMVASDVEMGANCVVHEGAILQSFCRVGEDSQILSGANVSHHCEIGSHCFLAGSVTLGGGCNIGDYCFIGMNATIVQGVKIASDVIVGAGSVVIEDILEPGTYVGSPVRRVDRDNGAG